MNKKLIAAIMALGLVITTSAPVLAQPTNIDQQKQSITKNKKSLNKVQNKRQDLEISIEKMDNQIEGIMREVDSTKNKITSTEKNIKKTKKDIAKAEKDIKDEQELFNKRVKAIYVSGPGSYLDIILEAKGLGDLISRVENVKKIMELDNKIIADFNEKKKEVESRKKTLDSEKGELVALKNDNEKKLSDMNKTRGEQKDLITELDKQEQKYSSDIKLAQAAIDKATKEVNSIRAAAPKYIPSQGAAPAYKPSRGGSVSNSTNVGSNANGSNIVAYASNFLGTPYQWGGNGPRTFDCSGFTKYVYAHFGIGIPRVASAQQSSGASISRGQLQVGDLVFFGSPAHHVGIYVGNGCYIHAPSTGDVVKISPLNRNDFSGGARYR